MSTEDFNLQEQNLLFSSENDYTTALFMDKFYTYIHNGNSYLEANHQSKLDFLADKNISNTKKSPYYWSAFVLRRIDK
jgi:CHAT domain-containing protein